MKRMLVAVTVVLTISGCQAPKSQLPVIPDELVGKNQVFDASYQKKLGLLITEDNNQEMNVLKLMEASLDECLPKRTSFPDDASQCASDSLTVVNSYMGKNFRVKKEAPPDYYRSFTSALKFWVVAMSTLEGKPTEPDLARLGLLANLSVVDAMKTMPASD
ncbi:hypothetical protein ACQKQA_04895 [Pseudomonas sp. NPDC089530]|uniref:hypothetical protein n=1 Tax=Pseudomonas sp. NPDC089530 TaxID=3390651 RepID=UPI003D08DC5A